MESNLSEVAPATLQSLSVVGSFLEFWKSLKKKQSSVQKIPLTNCFSSL